MMNKLIDYYKNLYAKYGYNESSLGWTKHKQYLRFKQLFRFFQLKEGDSILDVGCGFGDMRAYLHDAYQFPVSYMGIDAVEGFIERAIEQNKKYDDAKFFCGDFLQADKRFEDMKVDYIVASGIFGYKIYNDTERMYQYIENMIKKALKMAHGGVALNFLSNKVDYHTGKMDFHASPEKVLKICYSYTRNIVLDNSVMPFEYAVTLFPNQEFSKSTTIFDRYLELYEKS